MLNIRTNLKQEYNLDCMDVIDLIHNDNLISITVGEEMCIPNTEVTKNIILKANHDALLELFINSRVGDK